MDDFVALTLFIVFLGAVFVGGFYMGYRYRDNLSLQRQKKYSSSQPRDDARVSVPVTVGSAKIVKKRTARNRPLPEFIPRGR
jgi:hypothetical protein